MEGNVGDNCSFQWADISGRSDSVFELEVDKLLIAFEAVSLGCRETVSKVLEDVDDRGDVCDGTFSGFIENIGNKSNYRSSICLIHAVRNYCGGAWQTVLLVESVKHLLKDFLVGES
mgnify:CR=1 FL=1